MNKIRVGAICDSPFLNTGFGVVARSIMTRWPMDEFEVHVLGVMHHHIPKDIKPYSGYWPVPSNDPMGFRSAVDFLQGVDPDVLFMIGDPGTLRNRMQVIQFTGRIGKLPVVTYFPIEGIPLNPHIVQQANMVHGPVTYTKWGQIEMLNKGSHVDWVYHGIDHADFRPYPIENKKKLKRIAGLDDKFVVGTIGVNKRPNRYPSVLETAKILKDEGYDDVVFYLHTQEKGDGTMAGWELKWMITDFGLQEMIILKPNQNENRYIGRPRIQKDVMSLMMPEDHDQALMNLSKFGFIDLLNMLDLYLDPASVHGFNLPAAEAARCGVPIVMADDGFARHEIYGDVAFMLQPTASDWWHTGAILPLVSPRRMANAIIEMHDNEALRLETANKCKAKFDGFKWQPAADLFAEKIRDAHEYGTQLLSQNTGTAN